MLSPDMDIIGHGYWLGLKSANFVRNKESRENMQIYTKKTNEKANFFLPLF